MIRQLSICLLSLGASLSATPVFIGTNTHKDSGSKGIYFADFDPSTGQLSAPKLAAEYRSPGFLALHPSQPVLLAIGSPNKAFPDGSNSVAAFSIGEHHALTWLGEASSGGKGACHLAVDASGRTVAVANYSDGHISTVRLDDKGVPVKTVSVMTNQGTGPNKSRQEGPHAHGVYFDASNKHLVVPDLGLDKVLVYPFDASTSACAAALPPLSTAPGAGPRHMAFAPGEQHAYVINELDGTVLAASYHDGAFKAIGVVSTLPKDFSGTNTTAEIEVSQDGRFVYASNRGLNSIAVFARDLQSGALSLKQQVPCGGRTPRHFKIAPGGKWLLCAHQDSHTISVLPLNPASGELSPPASTVPAPSPICILFAR